jgi:hypothetical protein
MLAFNAGFSHSLGRLEKFPNVRFPTLTDGQRSQSISAPL